MYFCLRCHQSFYEKLIIRGALNTIRNMDRKPIYLQLCPEQLGAIIETAVRNILIKEKIIKSNKTEKITSYSQLMNGKEEELIKIKEVAQIMKLSKGSIYQKIYRNQIPFIKRGKQIAFNKSDILKLKNTIIPVSP